MLPHDAPALLPTGLQGEPLCDRCEGHAAFYDCSDMAALCCGCLAVRRQKLVFGQSDRSLAEATGGTWSHVQVDKHRIYVLDRPCGICGICSRSTITGGSAACDCCVKRRDGLRWVPPNGIPVHSAEGWRLDATKPAVYVPVRYSCSKCSCPFDFKLKPRGQRSVVGIISGFAVELHLVEQFCPACMLSSDSRCDMRREFVVTGTQRSGKYAVDREVCMSALSRIRRTSGLGGATVSSEYTLFKSDVYWGDNTVSTFVSQVSLVYNSLDGPTS